MYSILGLLKACWYRQACPSAVIDAIHAVTMCSDSNNAWMYRARGLAACCPRPAPILRNTKPMFASPVHVDDASHRTGVRLTFTSFQTWISGAHVCDDSVPVRNSNPFVWNDGAGAILEN